MPLLIGQPTSPTSALASDPRASVRSEASAEAARARSISPSSSGAIATQTGSIDALYAAVMDGDIGKMTPTERLHYYKEFCERLGLNPLAKPFAFYKLDGKLQMYALKEATSQLAKRDSVSVEVIKIDYITDIKLMEVHVRASSTEFNKVTGQPVVRVTDEIGCIAYSPKLEGEAAGNQRMKGVTKAKRRAILAHCGLGSLDEAEVETIQGAKRVSADEFLAGADVDKPLPNGAAKAKHEVTLIVDVAHEAEVVTQMDITGPGGDFDSTDPLAMDWLVRSLKSAFPSAARAVIVPLAECLKHETDRLIILTTIGELQKSPAQEADIAGFVAKRKK